MKNVLIVDDERSFLLSLIEGLTPFAADFNTLTANTGKRAVEVLNANRIDLVVTDLKMPEMDGFELLAYMSKHYSDLPVIVMTAYCTPEIKSRLESMGAFKLLEKPIDFSELVDTIFAELSTISKGYIRGITLPAFLQLVEMENKTCTLKILSHARIGYLYFKDGTLMGADNGVARDEKAAYDIVCWDDAEIEISSICREKTKQITASLSHILMEGFRQKDEIERSKEVTPGALSGQSNVVMASSAELQTTYAAGEGYHDLASDQGVTTKEAVMAGLQDILNEFVKLQGVDAVCLVGRDGFLLDSIARTGIDSEMIGAIASSGFGAAESMGRQLGKGAMSISMIEFDKGPVMFSPVGEDAFLVIIAEKDSNLGMIRLKLKKHTAELALASAL